MNTDQRWWHRLACLSLMITGLWGLSGCGYRLLGPEQGGPVAQLHLGEMADHTGTGELGQVLRRVTLRRLGAVERPRLTRREGPALTGRVRLLSDTATGFDRAVIGALYHVRVEVQLSLVDADGALLWQSRPVGRGADYLRAPTPVETLAAGRRARAVATEQASHVLLDELLATPAPSQAPSAPVASSPTTTSMFGGAR